MSNVKKFFCKDLNECDEEVCFEVSEENEAIEIKLIKQKSQGLISGYHYNFYRSVWNVKCNNGVECDCLLNNEAECYGDVRFTYKGQSVRRYFSNSISLANAGCLVFDELNEMYKEELRAIEEKNKQENENLLGNNFFDASMDILAVA